MVLAYETLLMSSVTAKIDALSLKQKQRKRPQKQTQKDHTGVITEAKDGPLDAYLRKTLEKSLNTTPPHVSFPWDSSAESSSIQKIR